MQWIRLQNALLKGVIKYSCSWLFKHESLRQYETSTDLEITGS